MNASVNFSEPQPNGKCLHVVIVFLHDLRLEGEICAQCLPVGILCKTQTHTLTQRRIIEDREQKKGITITMTIEHSRDVLLFFSLKLKNTRPKNWKQKSTYKCTRIETNMFVYLHAWNVFVYSIEFGTTIEVNAHNNAYAVHWVVWKQYHPKRASTANEWASVL